MKSAAPTARRVAGKTRLFHPRTLKRQFGLQAVVILLLAAVLTLESSLAFSRASRDLETINNDSIASIDAAQAMTQYLEDIDAKAADFLATAGLGYKTSCYVAGTYSGLLLSVHDCDEHNIDAEIVLANQALYQASHNVTYPGEKTAVERISTGMNIYLGSIQLMRTDYGLAHSKTDARDPSLQQAYQAYLTAGKVLHDQVSMATLGKTQIPQAAESDLPSCTINGTVLQPAQWAQGSLEQSLDCLSDINHTHLMQAYDDASQFLIGTAIAMGLLFVLLCGLLIFATLRMTALTHRLVNPGLLAACLISLILSFNTVTLLAYLGAPGSQNNQHSGDGAFQQMIKDDYGSIYDVTLLKRYATQANADKSRWLIALEFNDQPGSQHWQADLQSNVQQIQALMRTVHANQTWDEELQPLKTMDTTWNQYYTIDSEIQSATQRHGRTNPLLDAEEISSWESNWAFQSYTTALDDLSNVNRWHYSATFEDASFSAQLYFTLNLILLPLAALLALTGLALRFRDF